MKKQKDEEPGFPTNADELAAIIKRAESTARLSNEERLEYWERIIDICTLMSVYKAVSGNLTKFFSAADAVIRSQQVVTSIYGIQAAKREADKPSDKSKITIGFDDSEIKDESEEIEA